MGTAVTGVETFEAEQGYHFPSGSSLEFRTMVWSAGLAPAGTFTKSLEGIIERNSRNGRILVDKYLGVVKGHEGSICACKR